MNAQDIERGLARGWLTGPEEDGWYRFVHTRGRVRMRPDLPGLPVRP